jgi:hypothetical protein
MKNWRVTVNINNFTETAVIYIRNVQTKEEVYDIAKNYYITERPDIDFCSVISAEELK